MCSVVSATVHLVHALLHASCFMLYIGTQGWLCQASDGFSAGVNTPPGTGPRKGRAGYTLPCDYSRRVPNAKQARLPQQCCRHQQLYLQTNSATCGSFQRHLAPNLPTEYLKRWCAKVAYHVHPSQAYPPTPVAMHDNHYTPLPLGAHLILRLLQLHLPPFGISL